MKNTFSLIAFLLMISTVLSAQIVYNTAYIPTDDPPGYSDSSPSSMIALTDGSIVSVHNMKEGLDSPMPDVHNGHVIKVDVNGTPVWSKEFGEVGYDDRLNGICQTDDGGYLVVGSRGKIFNKVRSWILRLDAYGNLLWDKIFFDEHDNQHLLIERTSEATETYFVVGFRTSQYEIVPTGYVTAMKVNAFGVPFWANAYTPPDMPLKGALNANRPTAMVEDVANNGFVIAGVKTGSEDFFGVPSTHGGSDVFALGIGLNGFVYTDYMTYDVQPVGHLTGSRETAPDINLSSTGPGFVMAFGIDTGPGKNPSFDLHHVICMPLTPTLQASFAYEYDPGAGRGARATSVYPTSDGGYAMGCTGYRAPDGGLWQSELNRASFLKIDNDGWPVEYKGYDTGTNAGSRYMVESEGGYVLKADESMNNFGGMRLIKTDADGNSNCTNHPNIRLLSAGVLLEREPYGPVELPLVEFSFAMTEITTILGRLNCSRQGREKAARLTPNISTEEFKAYPSIVKEDNVDVTLDFSLVHAAQVKIGIFNSQGQLTQTFKYSGSSGNNTYQLDTKQLSPGVNTILLYSGDETTSTVRVLKL